MKTIYIEFVITLINLKNHRQIFVSLMAILFTLSCNQIELFHPQYRGRITATYKNGNPETVITYDLAQNYLLKQEYYYESGIKKHEGLYRNSHPDSDSPLLWWHENGVMESRVLFSEDGKVSSANIWYNNGSLWFSFNEQEYEWRDRNNMILQKGPISESNIKLPIFTKNGKFKGIRTIEESDNRLWKENWILFDDLLNDQYSGDIRCSLVSRLKSTSTS